MWSTPLLKIFRSAILDSGLISVKIPDPLQDLHALTMVQGPLQQRLIDL